MGCPAPPPRFRWPRPEAMSLTGQPPEAMTAPTRMATHVAAVSIVVLVLRPAMSSRAERMAKRRGRFCLAGIPSRPGNGANRGIRSPRGRMFGSVAPWVADHEARRGTHLARPPRAPGAQAGGVIAATVHDHVRVGCVGVDGDVAPGARGAVGLERPRVQRRGEQAT